MRFCSQMDDTINLLLLHQLVESIKVADIHLHELVIRPILNVLEISQITSVSQLIQVDYVIFWVFINEQAHYMASDKACATCDYYILHNIVLIYLFENSGYKSISMLKGLSKSFSISCIISFSLRSAFSVGIFQSIPSDSSLMLMPPSACGA